MSATDKHPSRLQSANSRDAAVLDLSAEKVAEADPYEQEKLAEKQDGNVVEKRSSRNQSAELPWDDCKVAFGVDDPQAFELWMDVTDDGAGLLPGGWSLCETDGTGARYVAIFRVEGVLRIEDGRAVAALLTSLQIEFAASEEAA